MFTFSLPTNYQESYLTRSVSHGSTRVRLSEKYCLIMCNLTFFIFRPMTFFCTSYNGAFPLGEAFYEHKERQWLTLRQCQSKSETPYRFTIHQRQCERYFEPKGTKLSSFLKRLRQETNTKFNTNPKSL